MKVPDDKVLLATVLYVTIIIIGITLLHCSIKVYNQPIFSHCPPVSGVWCGKSIQYAIRVLAHSSACCACHSKTDKIQILVFVFAQPSISQSLGVQNPPTLHHCYVVSAKAMKGSNILNNSCSKH